MSRRTTFRPPFADVFVLQLHPKCLPTFGTKSKRRNCAAGGCDWQPGTRWTCQIQSVTTPPLPGLTMLYKHTVSIMLGAAMQFRNPAVVIDETIANLEYLSEFFLDDIDHGALDRDHLAPWVVKALAALEATRILLPRLRVVRSNHVADSRLPDARAGMNLLTADLSERTGDAIETSATPRHAGVIR